MSTDGTLNDPHGTDIREGHRVQKIKGYKWPGVVVSTFKTLSGEWRCVVECTTPEVQGALHIYNREQLEIIAG